MYEKGGMGVDKDDAEAVRLFQLAASAGLDESCYSLAMHYKIGLGCEKDDSKCVHYLEEASVNVSTSMRS
jgi:TPR repeat protein